MIDAYLNHLRIDAKTGGDLLEQWDTDQECEHGRLPFDHTPECGCWRAGQVQLSLVPVTTSPRPVSRGLGVAA
jgi:hypothetical protein